MATLTYSHFGNLGRSYHRAHYTLVHKQPSFSSFLPSIVLYIVCNARKCQFSRPRRAAAGGRALAVAFFLTLYI